MNEPDELMTTAEVAAFLRTPAPTVRYWRSRHMGPKSFRLPRRVVCWRSDVLAWLTDQQRQTTTVRPPDALRLPSRATVPDFFIEQD